VHTDKEKLRGIIGGKCDWVMLDVPCSGTGVLRRNPDIKWKFTTDRVKELSIIQSLILEESLQFVRPKTGKIVYSTCSVLPEENLQQVIKFCEKHGYEIENGAHFTTLPKHGGMDGFFSATLVP
jgi:16S rRNA C967 or C1407 C5-methylase (RsmB/RsmF family)